GLELPEVEGTSPGRTATLRPRAKYLLFPPAQAVKGLYFWGERPVSAGWCNSQATAPTSAPGSAGEFRFRTGSFGREEGQKGSGTGTFFRLRGKETRGKNWSCEERGDEGRRGVEAFDASSPNTR